MTQHPDTPTSQSTAVRWTFYRRFGLLLRTRLQDDGTTYSLHDVAARTGGRVSAEELTALVAQGTLARPDAVTCVLLARALDVDPDYFVSDEAVDEYISRLQEDYRVALAAGIVPAGQRQLQQQVYALTAANANAAVPAAR
ncbi:MAG: hypothetical protein PVSMB4_02850 [Ktedonobacterales bacterium]